MKQIIFYFILLVNTFHFVYSQDNVQNEVIQTNNDTEPEIISLKWMNEDMTEEISEYSKGDVLSLLAYTRNYEEGDTLSITVKKEDNTDIKEGVREFVFKGIVDREGYVKIRSAVKTEDFK